MEEKDKDIGFQIFDILFDILKKIFEIMRLILEAFFPSLI